MLVIKTLYSYINLYQKLKAPCITYGEQCVIVISYSQHAVPGNKGPNSKNETNYRSSVLSLVALKTNRQDDKFHSREMLPLYILAVKIALTLGFFGAPQ